MTSDTHFKLGFFRKPHSFKGELIGRLDVEDPSVYAKVDRIFVALSGDLVPYFIDKFQVHNRQEVRLKLEEVDTEKQAKALVGCSLYLPVSEQLHQEEEDFQYAGFTVVDEALGELGQVNEFLDHPGNPLLHCVQGFTDFFIPLNAGFVTGEDVDSRILKVKLPEGYMDLSS